MRLAHGYVVSMIDEFGRRILRDAASGNYHDDIPEDRRDECRQVGQYLIAMSDEQSAFEERIIEPV